MSEKPRILQVGPIPPPIDGGIAAYLGGMLQSSLVQQYDMRPFCVRVPAAYREVRALRPFLSVQFMGRFARSLRREKPDLVHIHSSGHLGFWEKALFAGMVRRRGLPCLLHLHGGDFDRFLLDLPPRRAQAARRVLARASAVLVPCAAWRELVESFAGRGRVHIVPNAIRCDDFPPRTVPRSRGPVRLLFLGFVSARKGLDELLGAVRALLDTGCTGFELDIVGGEEERGQLAHYRQLYRAAGLGGHVRFHGTQLGRDKIGFLQRADIFVLPSRNESFGIANLEAMASGLPVVSTRTGAIPEYLEPGVHGLLVDPGDAEGLADGLRRLIADAELRARLGAAALRRAREYDWDVVAARVAAMYDKLLQVHAAAGLAR